MGSVVTPEGPKRVDQVKAGDLVASQMPGQDLEFTEVTIADEYKGDFTFVNFEFADGTSLNTTSWPCVARLDRRLAWPPMCEREMRCTFGLTRFPSPDPPVSCEPPRSPL